MNSELVKLPEEILLYKSITKQVLLMILELNFNKPKKILLMSKLDYLILIQEDLHFHQPLQI